MQSKKLFLSLVLALLVLPVIVGTNGSLAYAQVFQNQGRTVTGRVVDAQGLPVIGASIIIEGTTTGVITDADGQFSLANVPSNATLEISSIGYASVTVKPAGQNALNIVLEESFEMLDEVVAVGYASQRKATLTGSVANVKGEELVRNPSPNVTSSLTGRLPGLIVNQRSGEPGRDDPSIHIRGFGTFGDSSPLIIIDGVERGNLSRLNPQDIESISVLKDASAAIYGARAANGVILVTTKKGTVGKPEFSFDVSTAMSSPTIIPEMLDASTYATIYNEGDWYRMGRPADYIPVFSDDAIRQYGSGANPDQYPNTNWIKETMKPFSSQTKANFQVTGGSDSVRYLLSLGALTQGPGYYHQNERNNQYTLRSNLTVDLSKNFTVGVNLSAIIQDQTHTSVGTGINFNNLLVANPTIPAVYSNGLIAPGRWGQNPLLLDRRGYNKQKDTPIYTTLTASYAIPWVEGLKIEGSFNYDLTNQFSKLFELPYTYHELNVNTGEYELRNGQGQDSVQLTDTYRRSTNMVYNLRLSYDRRFGYHHVAAMIGQEQQQYESSYVTAYRKNFVSPAIDQLNVGSDAAEDKNNSGSASESARNDYFGRFNYDYASKYLLELIFRYDGSQNFPPETRYGFFPAASFGWRISEEPFIKDNLSFVDNLKLRFSAGKTGNDRVAGFQYLQSYSFGNDYVFGNTDAPGVYPNTLPNNLITWEKSTKYDLGLDFDLWKGKLSSEITVFKENRNDILTSRNLSIPNTLGFPGLPDENIGKVENHGYEIQMSHRNKVGDLTYGITGSLSYAKNKIIFMDETPNAEKYQNKEGRPIGASLYYQADGIFHSQAELDAYPHSGSSQVGDVRIVDLNGDGKIDSNDQFRFDKTSTPTTVFGLNFDFAYKGFDLTMFFQGQTGAYNYDSAFASLGNSNYDNGFVLRAKDRWTVDNPDGSMPRADFYEPGTSTFFLYDATFVRLKNLELGYSLPKKFVERLTLKDVRFYVSGYNLLTWAKEIKWSDPEISGSSLYYPQQRIVSFGVNVKF